LGRRCRRCPPESSSPSPRGKTPPKSSDQDHDLGGNSVESLSPGRGPVNVIRDRSWRRSSWQLFAKENPLTSVVPALHINRSQGARDLRPHHGLNNLSDDPKELTNAARTYLRQKFFDRPTAQSAAPTFWSRKRHGRIVESEGTAACASRCRAPWISLVGIEKKFCRAFQDLEVMLQLLARSATRRAHEPLQPRSGPASRPGDGHSASMLCCSTTAVPPSSPRTRSGRR